MFGKNFCSDFIVLESYVCQTRLFCVDFRFFVFQTILHMRCLYAEVFRL